MKKRFLYCLSISIVFIGLSILFTFQQSYAQSPTPSPVPTETPPQDSPTPENTLPSLDPTTDAPAAVEDADLPEAIGTPTTSPITQSVAPPKQEDLFGFDLLGFDEDPLQGPVGSLDFRFGVPADWQLVQGAELQLNFSTFFDYLGLQPSAADDATTSSGGSLDILFNDEPLTSVALNEIGEHSITIPITTTALIPTTDDRRHKLELTLDSGFGCDSDLQTRIVVHPTSHFILPHDSVDPPTDLRLLPWPIYQRSFLPDLATIVIPNQPTPTEMQAALAVASGFGKMTFGNITLSLTPVGRLTASIRETNHLIFVGNAEDFPLLKDANLPVPIGESGFEAPGAFPEDGVIQMAVSPWSNSKIILIVGGDSDIGIIKASQALSVGQFLTSGRPDLALIAEIQSEDSIDSGSAIDKTLADLGYSSIRAQDTGRNVIDYEFEIPDGYIADEDAHLDLTFNHSSLLDYEQSGGVVSVNGQAIGSVRFSDESVSLSTLRLTIPRTTMRTGINKITIEASLKPQAECYDSRLEIVWLTIWPESSLHIPLKPLDQDDVRALFDLRDYPEPFESNSTLNNIAFVLADNNPTAWNVAAQIAFDLGNRAKPILAEFAVAFGDDVPENIRQNHHLLVIGRPSQIPLLAELSDVLPAPFEPGSDLAIERGLRVRSRIPSDTSYGYLESLPAPWNRNWAILTMLGSTDQGIEWAGTALTTTRLRNQLDGNLAIIDNEHISIGDLKVDFVAESPTEDTIEEAVPEDSVVPETIDSPEPISESLTIADPTPETPLLSSEISSASVGSGRPDWLLPALITSTILMIVIVGVVIISAWRQHRLKN